MAFKLKLPSRKKREDDDDSPVPPPSEKKAKAAKVKEPKVKEPKVKKAAARKIKKFKATKGEKFVLFMGDEGAILVGIKNNVVLSRQFVPDAGQNNLDELRATLEKNPKAPLLLAVDTMDQSYVQQTLPPVSSMSVGKLIKRRLDRDFGANDIKGAIVLGREKGGRKDWNFLMIALEKSPQLTVWLNFIASIENRFVGIYLASVETEILTRYLDSALGHTKENGGAEWKFFVSHNKVGGFRQVILRDGRIVFTRLAQPVGESSPEVIAGNIEQEMLSTIEYMKRLSYNPATGLDIYIVASSAIKESIDSAKFMASNVHLLTPFEVAQYLNIEGATQPTDQFGDVILAAVIGCSREHVLKFTVPQTKKVDTFYHLLLTQRLMITAAALGLLGYMCYVGYDIYDQSEQMDSLEHKKVQEQRKLDDLRMEIKNASIDIDKVSDIIDLYKGLREEMISPLPFVVKIEPIILAPIRIQAIDWALVEETVGKKGRTRVGRGATAAAAAAAAAAAPPPRQDPEVASLPEGSTKKTLPQAKTALTLEFPVQLGDPRELLSIQNQLTNKFKEQFKPPFYTVTLPTAQQQAQTAASENMEINFGDDKAAAPATAGAKLISSQLVLIIEGDVIGGNTVVVPPAPDAPAPAITPPAPQPGNG